MSLNLEIIGSIHHVGETKFVTDTFSKREFVVHVKDEKNPKYDDYIQMQMVMDNCDKLDDVHFQDEVKVQVNLRGREYDRRDGSGKGYFNSLDAWRIETLQKAAADMAEAQTANDVPPPPPEPESGDDELPF